MTTLLDPPAGELTTFVGRTRELAALRHALASSRLVTLTGPGGVGKSRLAQQALATAGTSGTGEAAWGAELSEVSDDSMVAAVVAEALGLRPVALEEQTEHIVSVVGDRPALLLLDGCERVLAPTAALLTQVLRRCPRLRVVATSRQPLGLTGERVFPVPPLDLPPATTADPGRIGEAEAVALFVERAAAALPGFALTAENAPAVARVVSALDGLPLAIELAAARIRTLSPEAMVDRLENLSALLRGGPSDRPERQRSLEASVAWSAQLCSEPERTLWARLSVFSGRFDLESAEEICSGDGLLRADVLEVLSSLVDKSVVVRDPEVPSAHYRMLDVVREHGAATLERTDDPARWRARHRDHVLLLAERCHAEWVSPRQGAWIDWLQRNRANVQAVLEQCSTDPGQAVVALRIGVALELYWLFLGRVGEIRHWLDTALSHDLPPGRDVVAGLTLCGYVATLQRDDGHADRRLAEARAMLAAEPGLADDVTLARLSFGTGIFHLFRGDPAGAVPAFEDALVRVRRARHGYAEPGALGLLAQALEAVGQPERAQALLEECLELTGRHEELCSHSWTLWRLGARARAAGRLDEARGLAHRSLAIKERLGDRLGVALVLEVLADVAADAGDDTRSATLRGAAGGLWHAMGDSATARPYLAAHRALTRRLAAGGPHDRAYAAAYERGAAMPADEVAALSRRPRERPPASPLTAREQQVAGLLGEGMTDQEIADRLVISVRTAQGHVENIRRKLGFRSRTQVAAWVARGEL